MPKTKILLHFDEPGGVRPSDAMGNLEDLTIDDPTEMPSVVDAWTGRGRQFGGAGASFGLYAADRAGRDTLLQRDVTVQAILSYVVTGGEQMLIAGGLNDGTEAENPDYGLSFYDDGAGSIEVRWFHGEPGPGSVVFAPPGVFEHLGDGKFFLFTATRRWESSSRVVVRYYVGPEMITEVAWSAGSIGGGTTGNTTVGGWLDPGWTAMWAGAIDELAVCDFEMSPEQVRHTWNRLTVHQPAGVAMFAALSPPGLPWNDNPANNLGRRTKVAGQALGTGIAAIEELRDQWLPGRAPVDHIPDWEELCGLTAKPRDSLDVRRARVAGYFGREEGFSHPAVKVALEEVLDLASDDIEILEFENEIVDAFDTLEAERWLAEPAAEWSIAGGGLLRLHVDAAEDVTPAPFHVRNLRMPLDRGDNGRVFLGIKIAAASAASVAASSGAGLLLYNRATDNYLWFGVYNDAGTLKLAWQKRVATVSSAITFLAAAPAAPLWLRLYSPMEHATTLGASGQFTAAWSATGPTSGFTTSALGATGVTDSDWGALAATGGVLGGLLQVDFDDWISFCPDGDRSFCWYAYRPPALPGAPDMVGARPLVGKIKPAHTHASAIRSKSLLCDDPELGLLDHGPMGAL